MREELFLGRQQHLELLHKRVGALKEGYRQNIAMLGEEMTGKTSIIGKFLKEFCDPYTITVYLEVKPESLEAFGKRFIGALLYNFLLNSALPLKEDLAYLTKKSSRYIPRTTAKIASILSALSRKKKNNIFSELLCLCEVISQETGKYCVVIFDEFHNLHGLESKAIFKEWAKLLLLNKNTMFVITSSMQYKARLILSRELSLLFGNFQVVTVEPFDIKTSNLYLQQSLRNCRVSREIKEFIIHLTGGYPFYLKLFSEGLSRTEGADILRLLEELLFEPTGILNQRFYNYLRRFLEDSHSKDYLLVFSLLAQGHNRLNDLAHFMQMSKKKLFLCLDTLLESGAISRNGDFFKINDRVFSFWLRFVYQQKLVSLTLDQSSQRASFKEQAQQMLSEFKAFTSRPILERTAELLRYFEDEQVKLQEKKLRLDRFQEIKPIELNTAGLKEGLLGRSNESLWVLAFKAESLNEEDILDFSRECKKYRSKLQRKIIVTNADLDTSTRLRALEEKVWTWNLESLNSIFDLFYKPGIIL